MAHSVVIEAARAQSWRKRLIQEQRIGCVWEQLSNRTAWNASIPKASSRQMPKAVVNKVSDEFQPGILKTHCVAQIAPKMAAIEGPNYAKGKEGKATTKMVEIPYNIQRFPLSMGDMSVGGDMEKYYNAVDDKVTMIKDLFTEQTEYDCFRALCEGAPEGLTEAANWESSERGSEITVPLAETMHPNQYNGEGVSGTATLKSTWNATYSTAETTLFALLDAQTSAADYMSIDQLDAIRLQAGRTIVPIADKRAQEEDILWVLMMSDSAWQSLKISTTTNASFRDLMKYTPEGFSRLVKGAMGVYNQMLIVVAPRMPIYDTSASAGSRFKYVTPLADNRTRALKTTTGAGTLEISALLGNGALSQAIITEEDFEKDGEDYKFSEGICGIRRRGTVRTDLDTSATATSARINQSSFLWYSATGAKTL